MRLSKKIKILWIHDNPHEGLPGMNFPEKYQKYFEFSKEKNGQILPFQTISALIQPMDDFWVKKDTTIFPADIIAADYDLSQATSLSTSKNIESASSSIPEMGSQVQITEKVPNSSPDFDGLIVSIFYATLTRDFPSGFVPITYKMHEMSSSAPAFQKLTQKILGIKFGLINSETNERKWDNIINAGVRQLRERIKQLFQSNEIAISFDDMEIILNGGEQTHLNVLTNYGKKSYPIDGLFIDFNSDRKSEVKLYIEDIFENIGTTTNFRNATNLAKTIRNAYNDVELMEKRRQLSIECCTNPQQSTELKKYFKVKKYCGLFSDIRLGKYSIKERRLAVIILIGNLLADFIDLKYKIENKIITRLNIDNFSDLRPKIRLDDIYLALFPVPQSPLIYPWDSNITVDRSHQWGKYLSRLSAIPGENNSGLNLEHIINGYPLNISEKKYGLQWYERLIIKGILLDRIGATKLLNILPKYETINNILNGLNR